MGAAAAAPSSPAAFGAAAGLASPAGSAAAAEALTGAAQRRRADGVRPAVAINAAGDARGKSARGVVARTSMARGELGCQGQPVRRGELVVQGSRGHWARRPAGQGCGLAANQEQQSEAADSEEPRRGKKFDEQLNNLS